MSVLFVHDHKFRKVDNKIYSPGGLNDNVLKRYAELFGHVTVIARVLEQSDFQGLSEITNKNVEIKNFTDIDKKSLKNEVLKADKIIVRLPSLIGFKIIKEVQKSKKEYLVEVVGCAWDAFWNHSLIGKILALPMYLIMKKMIYNAAYAIYVTEEFLQKRYPTKGEYTSCSDVEIFSFGNDKVLEKRLNKIENLTHPIKLGTIASLDIKYKGQKYVMKAISEFKKINSNFQYVLVGFGSPKKLQYFAKKYNVMDDIIFLGGLNHKAIFSYLDDIDIYVQPSKTEGMPRALIEAMSRGCPSIGSDAGGIPELISKEYIFKKGSYRSLFDILARINKNSLMIEASKNLQKSQEFNAVSLSFRRKNFYLLYLNSISKHDT